GCVSSRAQRHNGRPRHARRIDDKSHDGLRVGARGIPPSLFDRLHAPRRRDGRLASHRGARETSQRDGHRTTRISSGTLAPRTPAPRTRPPHLAPRTPHPAPCTPHIFNILSFHIWVAQSPRN